MSEVAHSHSGVRAGSRTVRQQSKIELVINLKIAMMLGLAMPLSVFARADEVIE